MFAVYSSSFTRRKCLRMFHLSHNNMFRRHFSVRMNDGGIKQSVVFIQPCVGFSLSSFLKTADGIYFWITGLL